MGSDDLSLIVGSWAKDKLYYVQRYCHIFATGMKGRWRHRVYIDLFSGPGKGIVENSVEEIEGSPLLALKEDFTHYFFNDSNPDAITALKRRVGLSQTQMGSHGSVVFSNLDCNEAVDFIVSQFPGSALGFCFIDPFNWAIHFASVDKLARSRRLDLAITFHTGHMKRVAATSPGNLDVFFPNSTWLSVYRAARYKGKALLDVYEGGLRSLEYSEFKDYVLLKNTRGVPLYHLLFASRHRRGGEFWDKISEKAPSGQLRMLREETDTKYSP